VPALEAGIGLPPELEHPMKVATRNTMAEQRVRFLGTVVIIANPPLAEAFAWKWWLLQARPRRS
jgi:hypothetical protein